MTELRSTDAGIVERVYYAVPNSSGYGPEFAGTTEGREAAVAFAKSTIKRFDYSMVGLPDGFSRAFVDMRFKVRWLPAYGAVSSVTDMVVERVEIKLSEAEREALVPAGAR